jgi:hypothetical protein
MTHQHSAQQNMNLVPSRFPRSLQSKYLLTRGTSQTVISVLQKNIQVEIDTVGGLSENWDGYGSAAPNPLAVKSAKLLVCLFPHLFQSGRRPEISADEEGRIIIEWYYQPKTLALFIGAHETIVVKSWGPKDKIEDSLMTSLNDFTELWDWLFRR